MNWNWKCRSEEWDRFESKLDSRFHSDIVTSKRFSTFEEAAELDELLGAHYPGIVMTYDEKGCPIRIFTCWPLIKVLNTLVQQDREMSCFCIWMCAEERVWSTMNQFKQAWKRYKRKFDKV